MEDSNYLKTVDVTVTLNENLVNQLQQLVNAAGTDISTFFTSVAEQAVRAQELTLRKSTEHPPINLFSNANSHWRTRITQKTVELPSLKTMSGQMKLSGTFYMN